MPGILCSAYDPADTSVEPRWRHGLELIEHQLEHVQERYSADFFRQRMPALSSLSPPLLYGGPADRMADLLNGKIKATEQASTMLPPALFVKRLRQELFSRR